MKNKEARLIILKGSNDTLWPPYSNKTLLRCELLVMAAVSSFTPVTPQNLPVSSHRSRL
jgi:hypothetical protein